MTVPGRACLIAVLIMELALAACRSATTPMDQDAMPRSSSPEPSAAQAPPPAAVPRGGRAPKGRIELAAADRMGEPLERHLFELMSPYGIDQHVRIRRALISWLVAHADEAYPRLVAALRAQPDAVNAPAILEVLPHFQRDESIPVIEEVLGRGLDSARAAGIALGRHEGERAREALVRALASPFPETVAGAADGLAERADVSTCEALSAVLAHPDAITRGHIVQGAGKLGCLSMDTLERLEASDPDADVRAIAKELKRGRSEALKSPAQAVLLLAEVFATSRKKKAGPVDK